MNALSVIPGRSRVLLSASSMLICCATIAALATVKLETDPQCFYIYYGTRTGIYPSDWTASMAVFYLKDTSLPVFFLQAVLAWVLAVLAATLLCRLRLSVAFTAVSEGLSPLLLLVFPAVFWVDVPWTQWSIHYSFHDGRGTYPYLMFQPRIVLVIGLVTAVIRVAWEVGRRARLRLR